MNENESSPKVETTNAQTVSLSELLGGTIAQQDFNDEQCQLYDTMSDISEDCWCAGWLMGNEFAVWKALTTGDLKYGMGEMDTAMVERCRRLNKKLNGWIAWFDSSNVPGLPQKEWGARFIPMERWMKMVSA